MSFKWKCQSFVRSGKLESTYSLRISNFSAYRSTALRNKKKIADKLTKYDAWIQAEQKQLDLWKGVKKNMLDKMFI